ncbi:MULTISPECIES: hypothetical protein [Actinoalloteichus]|nr:MULTISPECIES: hypothetical protein [Actinoalloteichus]
MAGLAPNAVHHGSGLVGGGDLWAAPDIQDGRAEYRQDRQAGAGA